MVQQCTEAQAGVVDNELTINTTALTGHTIGTLYLLVIGLTAFLLGGYM